MPDAQIDHCDGGILHPAALIAGALADIPGSSDVIDRGFATYSNDAKRVVLGVNATTLATFGAVSKETATQMAVGALGNAGVDLAVAITGIAEPGGTATPGRRSSFEDAFRGGRPRRPRILHREHRFGAIGRTAVRERSVVEALRTRRNWRGDLPRRSRRNARRKPDRAAGGQKRAASSGQAAASAADAALAIQCRGYGAEASAIVVPRLCDADDRDKAAQERKHVDVWLFIGAIASIYVAGRLTEHRGRSFGTWAGIAAVIGPLALWYSCYRTGATETARPPERTGFRTARTSS